MPGLSDDEKNRRRQANYRAKPKAMSRDLARRKDIFLSHYAEGHSRIDCVHLTPGITADNSVDQWLKRDPAFKSRYEAIRAKRDGDFEPDRVPFDADFRQRFFGNSTPPHMQKLIDVLNEQTRLAEEEQSRDRRVLVLMPPEHAKTSVLMEYLVYRISMDETFRASLICSTQNQARKRLGAISRMLTDRSEYSDLIDTYGIFKSETRADLKPWTADHFTHMRAPAAQTDYTLQSMGWNGSIYGDRMDMIVYDDIATLKNQTPSIIEAMWEKTWGENRSRIRKGGLFVVIGTHMKEGDIYSVLQEKGFFSDVVVMPAIVREPGTLSDSDPGEALWEEGTSLRELLKIRETDLRMFELMYQQNPLPSVGAMFPLEAIESCYDAERPIGHVPEGSIVVAGIDPSVSNYTAGVVFALKKHPSGEWMRYLVDVWNEKNLTGDGGDNHAGVVDFIVELCRKYRVATLCVEDGTWMSLINNAFTLRSSLNDLGVRHIPIKATEETVGAEAIRQLSGLFNHRLISLPGTPTAKAHLHTMVNQFLTFTGEKSHWRKQFDIVKAFRQAEHAVKHTINTRKGPLRVVGGTDIPQWMLDEGVA